MIVVTHSGASVACTRCFVRVSFAARDYDTALGVVRALGWREDARKGRKPDWSCHACSKPPPGAAFSGYVVPMPPAPPGVAAPDCPCKACEEAIWASLEF